MHLTLLEHDDNGNFLTLIEDICAENIATRFYFSDQSINARFRKSVLGVCMLTVEKRKKSSATSLLCRPFFFISYRNKVRLIDLNDLELFPGLFSVLEIKTTLTID